MYITQWGYQILAWGLVYSIAMGQVIYMKIKLNIMQYLVEMILVHLNEIGKYRTL